MQTDGPRVDSGPQERLFEIMDTYVLYHASCLDGFGAAYAAWKLYGDAATYVPVKYQEPWPEEVISAGNQVIILDFSYDRETLLAQHQLTENLIVLDHHKSAKEALEGLPFAVFDMEKSGAVIAWEYFHPDEETPKLLLHVQDRDLWQFKMPATKAVCESLWAYPRDFERWDNYVNNPGAFRGLNIEGKLLLLAKKQVVSQVCYGEFTMILKGIRVVACNAPVHVSEVCHELLDRNPDCEFAIGFRINSARKWRWDFRSRKGSGVDVSVVAKHYGGGGHENAAGAITTHNILERTQTRELGWS